MFLSLARSTQLSAYVVSVRFVPLLMCVSPRRYMIDVVSGDASGGRDWAKVWLESENYQQVTEELGRLKLVNKDVQIQNEDDRYEYAASTMTQLKIVTARANVQIWRQTDYVINKLALHIGTGELRVRSSAGY